MVAIPPDAVITSILLPVGPERSIYRKAMPRATWSFALAGVALALDLDGGNILGARLALSGVAPIPIRIERVEQAMRGQSLAQLHDEELASLLVQGAQPLTQKGTR